MLCHMQVCPEHLTHVTDVTNISYHHKGYRRELKVDLELGLACPANIGKVRDEVSAFVGALFIDDAKFYSVETEHKMTWSLRVSG